MIDDDKPKKVGPLMEGLTTDHIRKALTSEHLRKAMEQLATKPAEGASQVPVATSNNPPATKPPSKG